MMTRSMSGRNEKYIKILGLKTGRKEAIWKTQA
jgi:hypothetical protein